MELVKPDIGLLFWMTICFFILLFMMRRFAWGPILTALNEREKGIQDALNSAEKAREEINSIKQNQDLLEKEARAQREALILESKKFVEDYKSEQKKLVDIEMEKRLSSVQETIQREKQNAVESIKKSVAVLSVDIAEKILEKKLEESSIQQDIINKSLENLDIK
tara:strand:- start:2440 stop:2934 length:495 start_codon:yes stop_codon:yes gene_type:complete